MGTGAEPAPPALDGDGVGVGAGRRRAPGGWDAGPVVPMELWSRAARAANSEGSVNEVSAYPSLNLGDTLAYVNQRRRVQSIGPGLCAQCQWRYRCSPERLLTFSLR